MASRYGAGRSARKHVSVRDIPTFLMGVQSRILPCCIYRYPPPRIPHTFLGWQRYPLCAPGLRQWEKIGNMHGGRGNAAGARTYTTSNAQMRPLAVGVGIAREGQLKGMHAITSLSSDRYPSALAKGSPLRLACWTARWRLGRQLRGWPV